MKRILSILITLFLFFSLSVLAAPAADQVIELTEKDGSLTLVATEPTTFWECPNLRAGETMLTAGTLSLVNGTNAPQTFTFDQVLFPYQDKQALEYLNHLLITVKQDETVLYDGAYSRINDTATKPDLSITLNPGQSCLYTISLRCDYAYAETDGLGDAILEWQFTVPIETTQEEPREQFTDPLFLQWGLAAIATLLLFLILGNRAKQAR